MSGWLHSLDLALFHWINQSLRNSLFDGLMPFLSWNSFFVPALIIGAGLLAWKGRRPERIFLILLTLILVLGELFIWPTIKEGIDRLRPAEAVLDARVLVGQVKGRSMPSAHAANWFAAAMIARLYYRRSFWLMLPLAGAVGFSRIYNGVHYPSDVLVGAILGAGYALLAAWGFNALWTFGGRRWFPLWWSGLPSLLKPGLARRPSAQPALIDLSLAAHPQWLRLGYLVIGVTLLARLAYLASGQIELSEDEAYQWVWSKHLALSYFSKPPLIAFTQRLGTALWGDTVFGIRFFSPVIAAVLALLLLQFLSREVNPRVGFWVVVVAAATPLLAVGATLLTIDPLSVLFWTAAMVAGWRAVQQDSTRYWLWTGLWIGLGFLSKYTALFQWLCWAVFFSLWKPARSQWRRPGPYLALCLSALCAVPVLIWNAQHGWITVIHVASDAGWYQAWRPTLRFFWDFLGAEAGLLNPVFFLGTVWASLAFWRRHRLDADSQTGAPAPRFGSGSAAPYPLLVYLFSMGAPLFLVYWLFTFHSRVFPNWIAPAILPLFCLMVIYWDARWRAGRLQVKRWLAAGLGLGLTAVVLLHDTDLIDKIIGRPLPAKLDPLRRVRAWAATAQVVGAARTELLAEGKPVFIIGDHYGVTGELTFYLAEAKAVVSESPLVYYQSSDTPANQFFFWPGYQWRKGQNAIFVQQTDQPKPPPERLRNEFASVMPCSPDLGMRSILYHGRVFRRLQLFECHDLR